jgi:cobalamin biosynthesis protein CobD/CbiB
MLLVEQLVLLLVLSAGVWSWHIRRRISHSSWKVSFVILKTTIAFRSLVQAFEVVQEAAEALDTFY